MSNLSKRLKKLKAKLIFELPFYPNDRETQQELENKNINDILFYYLAWKTRLIPCRKRQVICMPELTNDPRYKTLKIKINQLFDKVRNAENINHCLSLKAHRNGYVSEAHRKLRELSIWDDKDFILNTMGYHHFHLNLDKENKDISGRTNELLFAQVTKDNFKAIAIFDHTVFMDTKNGEMSPERKRMYDISNKYIEMFIEPGSVYSPSIISSKGNPFYIKNLTHEYYKSLYHFDTKLDCRNFVNKLYTDTKLTPPKNYNFEWGIEDLDLILNNKKDRQGFIIEEGPI